jgi:hypothetical protein
MQVAVPIVVHWVTAVVHRPPRCGRWVVVVVPSGPVLVPRAAGIANRSSTGPVTRRS